MEAVQDRISRIRLANALSDVLIDLKAALLEIESVELKYKKPRTFTTDAGSGDGEGRWVTLEGGNKAFIGGDGTVKKGPNGLKGEPLPKPKKPSGAPKKAKARISKNERANSASQTESDRIAFIKKHTGADDEKATKYERAVRSLTQGYQMSDEDKRTLEDFIKDSPAYDGEIFRGQACTDEEYDSMIAKHKVGSVVDGGTGSATSWTSNPEIASKYAKEKSKRMNSVTYKVERNETGAPVAFLSAHPSEDEVVLSEDARWEVTKVEEHGRDGAKKAVVNLREVTGRENSYKINASKKQKPGVANRLKERYSSIGKGKIKAVSLPKWEKEMVRSELNTHISKDQKDKPFLIKSIKDKVYGVVNYGFDNYTIVYAEDIEKWYDREEQAKDD